MDLSGNPEIAELSCYLNNLTDIIGLGGLTQLKHFECRNNSITNLTGIENATGLISLKCNSNQITTLPPFSTFPDFKYVNIGNNPLTVGTIDVSLNPQIIELGCERNNLTAIIGLENLTQLVHFGCSRNQLQNLTGIENATGLVSLKCDINMISSLPAFSTYPNFRYVNVGNNQLNLGSLDVSSNPLLIEFGIANSGVTDIVGLGNLTQLGRLDCSNNSITSLLELENITTLLSVVASYNELQILPDLAPSSAMQLVRAENNNLTFEDIEPNLFVSAFTYYNQTNVGSVQSIDLFSGNNLDITIAVGGTQNVYQWFKDGSPIAGATLDQLLISGVDVNDAGVYTLQISNTLVTGLTLSSEPITVNVSAVLPMEITDISSPLNSCGYSLGCNGDESGTATVTFTGGQEPYTILWSDGQSTATAVDLSAGDFTVTVTDANSTQITGGITITEADAISVTYDSSAPICEDSSSGAIDVTIMGGCSPYEYSWSGPDGYSASTEDIGLLSPGTYSLDVMDAQGCHSFTDVTIGSISSPEVSISGGNTVFLGYDPMACATLSSIVTGGSGSSTILWSTGDTNAEITVCPQSTTNYSVTVTDSNGCSTTTEVLIPVIDVSCGNNGDKVQICHVPNGDLSKAKTLCVSPNAVQAHLNKGDFLGSCDGTTTIDGYQPFVLDIYANPFLVTTQVQYEVFEEGTISIQVYDNQGFLLETPVSEFSTTGTYQFTFDRSSYSGSTFYLVANYQGHEWISNSYTLIGL